MFPFLCQGQSQFLLDNSDHLVALMAFATVIATASLLWSTLSVLPKSVSPELQLLRLQVNSLFFLLFCLADMPNRRSLKKHKFYMCVCVCVYTHICIKNQLGVVVLTSTTTEMKNSLEGLRT